ncbi:MAG: hypothetical protein M1819_003702 [Sarea resinae]|nr:MAG: hypothetical protein M1819_003702 [Sarea resinae]
MARPQLKRASSSSTLSCISVHDAATDSLAGSSTPPTSNTERSNMSPDLEKQADTPPETGRVLRARPSVGSYNEHVLSGTAKKRNRKNNNDEGGTRNVSGATLVNSLNGSEERLLGRSIDALNLSWDVDGLKDGKETPSKKAGLGDASPVRRKSTRLSLLTRATGMVTEVKSSLGKRGRGVLEAGKEKLQTLGVDRRSSLRPRDAKMVKAEVPEEPANKKMKLADGAAAKPIVPEAAPEPKQPPRPRSKRWLSHGLYSGQESPSGLKNHGRKGKKSPLADKSNEQLKSFLRLPIFTGERLLENGRDFRLPFDVFSPLPHGQPKPEEWRKTQKNHFVGEAATIWKKHKVQELSRCICTPETGCDENCQNRYMFYECDDSNCNIGAEHCTNRSFAGLKKRCQAGGKYNIGVEVIKTLDRGYGVRSNRTFEPNQIIVEYAGEIITQEECEKRMKKEYKNNECYYLMLFDQNMIIDATRGSIARFVNHSCEPNCSMVKWTVAGRPRMALFAGERGIMTGEELTYDYNFDPFSIKNVQECRCGAPTCRGVLGPRTKDHSKPKEDKGVLNPIITGAKRKLGQLFSGADENSSAKKRKIFPESAKAAKAAIAKSKTRINSKLTKKHAESAQKTVKSTTKSPMPSPADIKSAKKATTGKKSPKKTPVVSPASSRRPFNRTTVLERLSTAVGAGRRKSSATDTRLLSGSTPPSLARRKAETSKTTRRVSVNTTKAALRDNVVQSVRATRRAAAITKSKFSSSTSKQGRLGRDHEGGIRIIGDGGGDDE